MRYVVALCLLALTAPVRASDSGATTDSAEECRNALEKIVGRINNDGKTYDQDATFAHCTAAAEQGDASAQYILSSLYFYGLGTPANEAKAVELVARAAKQGYKWAQYDLGNAHLDGVSIPKDKASALEWFMKAAEPEIDHDARNALEHSALGCGVAQAQFDLGFMYDTGKGVRKDRIKAVELYTAAAERGHPKATFNLGWLHARGKGVPKDYIRAYFWWSLPALKGDRQTANNLDILRHRMKPKQIAEAKRMAEEWLEKSVIDIGFKVRQP